MKKGKKGLIIAFVIVAVIGLIIFLLTRKKKDSTNGSSDIATGEESYFPLMVGDNNQYVSRLQTWLVSKGENLPSGIDGIFGDETKQALFRLTGKYSFSYEDYKKI